MALADRTLFKDRDFLENKIKPCKINLTRVYIDTFYDIDFNLIIPRMGMSITDKLDSLEDAGTFDEIGVQVLEETLEELGILMRQSNRHTPINTSEYILQPFNNLVLLSNFYRLAKPGQNRDLRHLVTTNRNDERTRRGLTNYPGVVPRIHGAIILPGDDQYFTDVSGKDALGFTFDLFKEKYIESYVDVYGYDVPIPFDNIEKMKRYFILVLLGFDDYYNYMLDLNSLIDKEKSMYKFMISDVEEAKQAIEESSRLQRESIHIDVPIISKEYSNRYKEAINQAKISKVALEEYAFHKLNMEKHFEYMDSIAFWT